MAALTPLVWIVLALCHPRVLAGLRCAPAWRIGALAVGLTLWASLVAAVRFDPYVLTILTVAAAAAVGAPGRGDEPRPLLDASTVTWWLARWMTLDLRAYARLGLWLGPPSLGYPACALLVVALAGLGLAVVARRDVGLAPPRLRDLPVALLAFGLMHWNNAGPLGERLAYVGLASVGGLFYELAFRRTGTLVAPVLSHALVDHAGPPAPVRRARRARTRSHRPQCLGLFAVPATELTIPPRTARLDRMTIDEQNAGSAHPRGCSHEPRRVSGAQG